MFQAQERESTSTSWYYLFVHHKKMDRVRQLLEREAYEVFVHTSIVYCKADRRRVRKEERPTISGLLFVRGDLDGIRRSLSQNFFGLYLVKDCGTGLTACIADSVMQPFMRLSAVNPARIRFMPHTFSYYSEGNALVRITSGPLAGLEGFRIRIARDKCIVTSIGGMTVAIGGIHKESFENLDEYVRLRRGQLGLSALPADEMSGLTPVQAEIARCFFHPATQLDVMAIVDSVRPWMEQARTGLADTGEGKNIYPSIEICLFLIGQFGHHFRALYEGNDRISTREATATCRELSAILHDIIKNNYTSSDLKETVESSMESLHVHYPFLPL
ncbi:MAG: transcriptional regulator [Mediterranea sp.]|jgi:hypothetical protein|nr:transcriptional regulator [Mediterranea sp.]